MLDQNDAAISRRLKIIFGIEHWFGVQIHNIDITGANHTHIHGNKFYYLYVLHKEMKWAEN